MKHFDFVYPPGACGGGEFWLAGRGSLLGNVALPDAVVTTKTHPQNQRPDNRGEGGWVCEVTDGVSDWERDKAIKTSLGRLSGSAGILQVWFPAKVHPLCVFLDHSQHIFKLPRRGNLSFYTLYEPSAHGMSFSKSALFLNYIQKLL